MSTSDLTLAGETLPAETPETVLSDADLAALRRAVQVLERPSLAARLSAAAG
ncbi:EcsC family protein, partial [Escherichia coli]|nr:EcsC family protein [Escherichia coli]